MPQRPSKCRRCSVSGNERFISRKGLCTVCSEAAVLHNARGLQRQDSPEYARWLAGCQAAFLARAAPPEDTGASSS